MTPKYKLFLQVTKTFNYRCYKKNDSSTYRFPSRSRQTVIPRKTAGSCHATESHWSWFSWLSLEDVAGICRKQILPTRITLLKLCNYCKNLIWKVLLGWPIFFCKIMTYNWFLQDTKALSNWCCKHMQLQCVSVRAHFWKLLSSPPKVVFHTTGEQEWKRQRCSSNSRGKC